MSLEVIKRSVFSTIQDRGRPGYARWGVPVSGMMDDHSGRLANWLAGNSPFHPLIEVSLTGGKYQFQKDGMIGITGAPAICRLNEEEISMNISQSVKAGDMLTVGRLRKGRFLYLAVHGLEIPEKVMGSYSTYVPGTFGGINGGIIKEGDLISYQTVHDQSIRSVPGKLIPHFGGKRELRVTEGPEWYQLKKGQQKKILATIFKTDPQSNRMGIRLKSEVPCDISIDEMMSSPVVPGIVQYSGKGNYIILHRDGQTIGGYPRLLKVIDADLWRAAQLIPDAEVSINMISMVEAVEYGNYMESLYPPGTTGSQKG